MITNLQADNLLSFKALCLDLGHLNVFIGPNGSGKSNLISALAFMQSTVSDPMDFLRDNGGARDWIFKNPVGPPDIAASMTGPKGSEIFYCLCFKEHNRSFAIESEEISGGSRQIYYTYQFGQPPRIKRGGAKLQLVRNLDLDKSILSQRRDPDLYPQLTFVADTFSSIRFYRDWRLGRDAPMRHRQPTDLPVGHLLEDGRNLGLVLNHISRSEARDALLKNLRDLYNGIEDFELGIAGNSVEIFLKEAGGVIPASRLSDGTLRWLCLLCILLNPSPPPMVCIEEPELGLHPDLIPTLARLLIDASERMQLIVTTHSDALVDALTDTPESVIVCEKIDGATECRRLDKKKLKAWLKNYTLGALWRTGEIGGNRW